MIPWLQFARKRGAVPRTVDERFTDLADRVSEAMGKWRTSAFCLCLIALWAGFGPATGYSDSWQLWVNTPTTVVELFLGLFTLAAANRVEKRNWELHQAMAKMLQHLERAAEAESAKLDREGEALAEIRRQVEALGERLAART